MVAVHKGIVDEHTELAALISSVRRSHATGASWEDLARMLDELVATVRSHFASEEQQMERAAYPMLAEHRKTTRRSCGACSSCARSATAARRS